MAKMSKKWIFLCSAALGAVYAAEYIATDTPLSVLAPRSEQTADTLLPPASPSPAATSGPTASPTPDSSPSPSRPPAASSPAPKKTYRDGTYTGMGMNRRGSIQVMVTIKNDKITDVEIRNFAMHYSEEDVVGLPDEVLQTQSAKVDNVSGATYSTRAFEDAVKDALDQARNA